MNTLMIRLFLVTTLMLGGCAASSASATGPARASDNIRLTAAEIEGRTHQGATTGTSGVDGIETIALDGDAKGSGPYVIELRVPAHTTIQAHNHPDDRTATVVSGDWYFGYGDHFDQAALKVLPAGSFYTEPASVVHFAQTGDEPVVLHISGHGPSGVKYAH